MNEIAEQFVLPDSLAKEFYNRGYYGDLKHNVRATYQLYLASGMPIRLISTRCRRPKKRRNMLRWSGLTR